MTFYTALLLASVFAIAAMLSVVGADALADIAAQSTGLTADQAFFVEIVKAVVPGIGVVAVGAVGAWFAARAAARAGRTEEKTDKLAEKTEEMSKSMDGTLSKIMALVEQAALLKGAEQERIRADAQKVTDTATARADAREDRAEGMAAMTPQPAPAVIPVETRTEAAEAQGPKEGDRP